MVTAIILNYQRPKNMQPILSALHSCDLVSEIIVWNTQCYVPAYCWPEATSKIRQIDTSWNCGVWSRYIAGLLAKNECLFFQDDDLLVPAETVAKLHEAWCSDDVNHIHTLFGRMPTDENTYAVCRDHDDCFVNMTLGRAHMIRRYWCAYLFYKVQSPAFRKFFQLDERPYPEYEEELILSYAVRHFGGGMVRVHNLPRTELPEHGVSIHRTWDHIPRRTAIMRKCQEFFGLQ